MLRLNRSELCGRDEVRVFHQVNRCVRRTYLCGKDRRSGKDDSYRKQWIRDRLEELAAIFGIDLLGFAVLSNHLHAVAGTRPDDGSLAIAVLVSHSSFDDGTGEFRPTGLDFISIVCLIPSMPTSDPAKNS